MIGFALLRKPHQGEEPAEPGSLVLTSCWWQDDLLHKTLLLRGMDARNHETEPVRAIIAPQGQGDNGPP